MRRTLIAASALAVSLVCGAGVADAGVAGGVDGLRAALGAGLTQNVARVCRESCDDSGYCRRRCFDRPDYGYRERRGYREYDGDAPRVRTYEQPRYYERRPGISIDLGE